MHKNSLLFALTAALLLVGCMGSAQVRGSASVSAPDLIYISPGVQVIADYHEPVFYTDSYYWRYSGSVWYRSSNYTSGWVRFQAPTAILRIERPSAYVRYRAQGRANAAVVQSPAASNQEQREMKAEQKEERKEERKEQQQERKEERKEQQQERKDSNSGNGNSGNGNSGNGNSGNGNNGNNGKKGKN